jgi:hypothetical protein
MKTAINKTTRNLTLSAASLLLLGLGACAELDQTGEGIEPGSELSAEQLGAVEQATFSGNLGTVLGSPIAMGNTNGLTHELTPTCVSTSTAPEASFIWTAPTAATYVFSTAGSSFDTVIDVMGLTGASLGCNDDFSGTMQSQVTVPLALNQVVLINVDGWRTSTGAYRLNVNRI